MNENNGYVKRSDMLDLPEVHPWNVPVDGAELLDGLTGLFGRYVVLPRWAAETLALWTVHTYAFTMRGVTTYLGVVSPEKRCGKTTLLTLLSMVAYRALVASNISPPALFRVIEEVRPTLLIDEADTFLQGKEELRGILNAGYSRESAYVVRVDATIWSGLKKFSCWCPKVIAAIGELPDTLADRCIVVTMQRKRPRDVCERLRKCSGEEWRRKCTRFAWDNSLGIERAEPTIPETLNDRAADIWEPLLAIADLAGGRWPGRAREAAVALSGGKEDTSEWGRLLRDIQAVFEVAKADKLFSRTLLAHLAGAKHPGWEDLRKGKPVTDVWLAQQLRRVGVASRTVWIDGTTAKGYHLSDFEEAFERYAMGEESAGEE